MHISIDNNMMREIIMDHYSHPRHKKTPANIEDFQTIHMDSVSCIDNIHLFIRVENDIVKEALFDGIACTISTASTDILCDLVENQNKEKANYIIEQYLNMIYEKEFDEEALDEALVFANTSKQPARIKCATIGWNGMKELIK